MSKANQGAKPRDPAAAKKRKRALLAALVVSGGYLAIMQPQQVERFTRQVGSGAVNLGIPGIKLSVPGTIETGNLPAINADPAALAELVESGGSSGGSSAGGANGRAGLGLETFWAKQRAPGPGETDFALKAELATARGTTEQVWVRVVAREGRTIAGLLVSEPRDLNGLRQGSKVTFDVSRVAGWTYKQNGKAFGSDTRP